MSKSKLQQNIDLFKCPLCGNKMDIHDLKSLLCSENHCFDLSKHGYVNLLLHAVKTKYDKTMLKSRSVICKGVFFEPMIEQLSEIIIKGLNDTGLNKRILDVGCGEGSHLQQIINKLHSKTAIDFAGVGIDISKEGIQLASKQYPDNIWCVGDLAKNPFMNNKFDVILNILSPSNYSEFSRIITDNGILIKVIPESNYLKELRAVFYDQTDKQTYSNEKVVEIFNKNFNLVGKQRLHYSVELDKADLEHLIKMTPLSWNASQEKVDNVLNMGIDHITVDFTIMYGKK